MNDFKYEDWCPDSKYTYKLDMFNPMGSKGATRLEDIESGFIRPNYSITPSFQEGLTVPI